MVELTQDEYNTLAKDQEFLRCLQAAGVDNWEGYEVACRMRADELQEGDI